MKVLVAVKRVLDYNLRPAVSADGKGVDLTHLKMSMNPFDEIAMEEAVQLKEKGLATQVLAVSIGPKDVQETLRSALALGADEALWVDAPEGTEPLDVAKILAVLVKKHNIDCVIMGKQAIDDDCNQTGQMVAALLDWPQGTFTSDLDIQGKNVTLVRETDDGLETLKGVLPMVMTTDLRLNEPRYPKLPNIIKAKSKPLHAITLEELGVTLSPRHTWVKVTTPPPRPKGIMVTSVDDLVQHLKSKGAL